MSIIKIMKIKKEREALQKMLDDFNDLTGLAAVVNDEFGKAITDISNISPYCEYMRAQGNLCPNSDREGAEIASRIGATCVYICHAGLIDLAIPIIYDNRHIGSILAGQVRTETSIAVDLSNQELMKQLKSLELEDKYLSIPFMDEDKIIKASRVLEIIAKYIVERLDNLSEVSEKDAFEENILDVLVDMKALNYKSARIKLRKTLTFFLPNATSKQALTMKQKQFHRLFASLDVSLPDRHTLMDYKDSFPFIKDLHRYFYQMFDYAFSRLLDTKLYVVDDLTYTKAFMDRYFYKALKYSDLAQYANYSSDHFAKLFKQQYDTTPKEYLMNEKIKVAKELLLETDLTIQEVSQAVGYDDPNYFTRAFKKCVGISPSVYRKN